MSGRRSVLSDSRKAEIARELGVYEQVKADGWRNVSSKDCGNIVKKALEISERAETKNK